MTRRLLSRHGYFSVVDVVIRGGYPDGSPAAGSLSDPVVTTTRELRAFLECGILAHGFARVHSLPTAPGYPTAMPCPAAGPSEYVLWISYPFSIESAGENTGERKEPAGTSIGAARVAHPTTSARHTPATGERRESSPPGVALFPQHRMRTARCGCAPPISRGLRPPLPNPHRTNRAS